MFDLNNNVKGTSINTAFVQFIEAANKIAPGEFFIRIYKVRDYLGWTNEEFDTFLKLLSDKGVIGLNQGNPRDLSENELKRSYIDPLTGGYRITFQWYDKQKGFQINQPAISNIISDFKEEKKSCSLIIGAANQRKAEIIFEQLISCIRAQSETILIPVPSEIVTPNTLWGHVKSYLKEAIYQLSNENLISFGIEIGKILERLETLKYRPNLGSQTVSILEEIKKYTEKLVKEIENTYLRE